LLRSPPVQPHRPGDPARRLTVAAVERAIDRHQEVRLVGLDAVQPAELVPSLVAHGRLFGELPEGGRMGASGAHRLLAQKEASGVLCDRFQQVVPTGESAAGTHDDQRLFGEPLQQLQHTLGPNAAAAGGDLLDGRQGRPAPEDAEHPEEGLLLIGQQAVAPVERCPHGPLPLR
jgi:hypothetical protein